MTEDDEQYFRTMDGCHACGNKYTDKDVRVRDHCHITGKFRGSEYLESLELLSMPSEVLLNILTFFL